MEGAERRGEEGLFGTLYVLSVYLTVYLFSPTLNKLPRTRSVLKRRRLLLAYVLFSYLDMSGLTFPSEKERCCKR